MIIAPIITIGESYNLFKTIHNGNRSKCKEFGMTTKRLILPVATTDVLATSTKETANPIKTAIWQNSTA